MRHDLSGRDPFAGFRHESLDAVTSTNEVALQRARAGAESGLWITARSQSLGRGRRGRSWASEAGNLYASLLLIDPAPAEALATLPLAVAVAAYEAVRAVLPLAGDPLEIKWPNDLLIGRRKCSGILLESEMLADRRRAVIIGIGINIRARPEDGQYPITSLAEHGASASPEDLFSHLFRAMAETLAVWDQGRGTSAIVARWRRAACGIGERITVNLTDRSLSGHFAGIGDDGMLILECDGSERRMIAAGDVFFG